MNDDDPEVVQVFLDGEIQGMIVEADADKGYVLKRTLDGTLLTMRGKVRIIYKGKEVSRAELRQRREP